jgi:hypothetical protein
MIILASPLEIFICPRSVRGTIQSSGALKSSLKITSPNSEKTAWVGIVLDVGVISGVGVRGNHSTVPEGEGVTVSVSAGSDGIATGKQALSEKKITNIQNLFININA